MGGDHETIHGSAGADGKAATNLVLMRGRATPPTVEVQRAETTLGRHGQNDIVIDSEQASRFHATVIRRDGGGCALVDLGSANGTFLNKRRLEPGTEYGLCSKDVVAIADCQFVFLVTPPGGATDTLGPIAIDRPKVRREAEDLMGDLPAN